MEAVETLSERLTRVCVGHEFPVIMASLSMVTGCMIGMHAKSQVHADAMVEGAVAGIRHGVDLSFAQNGDVH